jgi:N-dimethylarginine dimethylaminohydrolase
MARPSFLVCPPDHFDTHFLFNPFMTYRERVRPRRARAQWRRLVRTLEQAGAGVEVMDPSPVSSALPFTADGALCYGPRRALVLRNDGPRGDREPPLFTAWFRDHGYQVEALPPERRLDGGNLLWLPNGDLVAGIKPTGTGEGERYLEKLLALVGGGSVWTIPLAHERHLHLDTAVAVLGERAYLVYPEAIDADRVALSPLEGAGAPPDSLDKVEVIEVDHEDARRFACNLVVVGDVVITGRISRKLSRRIEKLGYSVERLNLDEFHKAGGGAKCLTLPLWPELDGTETDPRGGSG